MCVQNVLDPKYVRSIKEVLEYLLSFVHPENDPNGDSLNKQKPMQPLGQLEC
jgi:hypothetical protein